MIKRFFPVVFVISTLLMSALACRLSRSQPVPLGEAYQSDMGGFILQKVPDYDFEEFFGFVVMMAPDADHEIGPFIMAHGALTDEAVSAQEILDEMQTEARDASFRRPRTTRIDGVEGLLIEFSGEEAGQSLKGKLFVAAPRPSQEFYITAISPEGRWREVEPLFDAVLNSVKFIDAQPFEFELDDWEWEWEEPDEEIEEVWEPEIEPEIKPVLTDGDLLGDDFEHNQGVFSFQKINGYEFTEFFDQITMIKPGRAEHLGPTFTVTYGEFPFPEFTIDILNYALMDDPSMDIQMLESYLLDGVWGLLVDYNRAEGSETLQSRWFLTMLTPYEYFGLEAIAPVDEWSEVLPLFDAVLASVNFKGDADDLPPAADEAISQWASYASASSEYSSTDYAALQATGAPNVDGCAEDIRAWASAAPDTQETLILFYDAPVRPTQLTIYETHNPSQIVKIELVDTSGVAWVLWQGEPDFTLCPHMLTINTVWEKEFYIDKVIIYVDQSVLGIGWAEIDAVELVGYPMDMTHFSDP